MTLKSTNISRHDTIFLRFIAIILIVNSHFDLLYPIAHIATGGAIGNSLFFFLSAFGLSISQHKNKRNFYSYIKRRITRIYPSIWAELIILYIPYKIFIEQSFQVNNTSLYEVMQYSFLFIYPYHHWFIHALMINYTVSYPFTKKIKTKSLVPALIFIAIVYIFIYLFLIDTRQWTVESTYIRYIFYMIVFFCGILLSDYHEKIKYKNFGDWLILLLCLVLFYSHKFLMIKGYFFQLQFLQQLILLPIILYLFKISRSSIVQKTIMETTILFKIIKYISSRTLEIYIVHLPVMFTVLNLKIIFPFNFLLTVSLTLILAEIIKGAGSTIFILFTRLKSPNDKILKKSLSE
jgi:hypothetical protein